VARSRRAGSAAARRAGEPRAARPPRDERKRRHAPRRRQLDGGCARRGGYSPQARRQRKRERNVHDSTAGPHRAVARRRARESRRLRSQRHAAPGRSRLGSVGQRRRRRTLVERRVVASLPTRVGVHPRLRTARGRVLGTAWLRAVARRFSPPLRGNAGRDLRQSRGPRKRPRHRQRISVPRPSPPRAGPGVEADGRASRRRPEGRQPRGLALATGTLDTETYGKFAQNAHRVDDGFQAATRVARENAKPTTPRPAPKKR